MPMWGRVPALLDIDTLRSSPSRRYWPYRLGAERAWHKNEEEVVGVGVGNWLCVGVGVGAGDGLAGGLVGGGVLGGGVLGMLDAKGVVDGLSVPVGLVTV